MFLLPDPADLVAIAGRIAGHAAATRDRATRLDHAIADTGWTGAAAAAFRLEARPAIDTLRGAANRLDDAADALRRHAARIGDVLADLARLGSAELDLAGDLVLHPGQVLPDVVDVVGDGAHVVADVAGGVLDAIGF
jgi:uncharacterized protein YukE